jgi:undecaprenyl-diphosphatase
MDILKTVILGLVQGFTEFLPVSSSGHLVFAKELTGLEEVSRLYDILLHIATMVAVIIVFRKRIWALLVCFFTFNRKSEDWKMITGILAATAVTAAAGFFLDSFSFFENPKIVSVMLIITGVILYLPVFIKPLTVTQLPGLRASLIIGLAQGIGVIPGISRSGITISAALMTGVDRRRAGEFSFILSIPAILGAMLLEIKDIDTLGTQLELLPMICGFAAALAAGLFSLTMLLKLIQKGKFHWFSYYVWPLGLLGLILF